MVALRSPGVGILVDGGDRLPEDPVPDARRSREASGLINLDDRADGRSGLVGECDVACALSRSIHEVAALPSPLVSARESWSTPSASKFASVLSFSSLPF